MKFWHLRLYQKNKYEYIKHDDLNTKLSESKSNIVFYNDIYKVEHFYLF